MVVEIRPQNQQNVEINAIETERALEKPTYQNGVVNVPEGARVEVQIGGTKALIDDFRPRPGHEPGARLISDEWGIRTITLSPEAPHVTIHKFGKVTYKK